MNKNLVISMEKKSKNEEKKNNRYLRREFSYSKFQQTIVLSDNVNKDNISAQVENGVLTIGIPKLDVEEFSKEVKVIEVK